MIIELAEDNNFIEPDETKFKKNKNLDNCSTTLINSINQSNDISS